MGRKKKKFKFYGVRLDDREKTGWIRINKEGRLYDVVDERRDATVVPCSPDPPGTKDEWAEFFNTEPELEGWKFHPVGVTG